MSFLKPLKLEKRIKGITAYPRIQLFYNASVEINLSQSMRHAKSRPSIRGVFKNLHSGEPSLKRCVLDDRFHPMPNWKKPEKCSHHLSEAKFHSAIFLALLKSQSFGGGWGMVVSLAAVFWMDFWGALRDIQKTAPRETRRMGR